MRNLVGAKASKRFADKLIASLKQHKIVFQVQTTKKGKFQGIKWRNRAIVFDKTPSWLSKNIDAILIDTSDCEERDTKKLIHEPSRCLAFGEIKGGIDPAGADEHWKTANSALERIRNNLNDKGVEPKLFFIGSAIEQAMAQEIYNQLEIKKLSFAANLHIDKQMDDLVNWLVDL